MGSNTKDHNLTQRTHSMSLGDSRKQRNSQISDTAILSMATQGTRPAQPAEAFLFLNMPLELQILVLEKLCTKPWFMKLSDYVASCFEYGAQLTVQDTLPFGALQVPELRKVIAEIFHPRAVFQKSIEGTLYLSDNIYNILPREHEYLQVIQAVSNGITALKLVENYSSASSLTNFKTDFPNLRTISLNGNKGMKDYWFRNGPPFAKGNLIFGLFLEGDYDDLLLSHMSNAIDFMIPSPKHKETKDVEIRVTIGIRGNHIQEFRGWSHRLGSDDVLAVDFVKKRGQVRITRKWFYVAVENSKKSWLLENPICQELRERFAEKNVDCRLRPAPEDLSELVLLD